MSEFLTNKTISTLSKALDGLQLRQQAISNNIANVDTPEYKRKDVNFESQLKAILNKNDMKLNATNNQHFSTTANLDEFAPKIATQRDTSIRNDENNVDIDYEMTALAKNQLRYQATTKLLSQKFRKIGGTIDKLK